MAIATCETTPRHLNTAVKSGGRWQGELENAQTTPPPEVRGMLPTIYDQVIKIGRAHV